MPVSCACGIWAKSSSRISANKRIPRNFRGISIILLTINGKIIIMIWSIGAWRSLVSRLVRVQEASGSNPDAPTKIQVTTFVVTGIFFVAGFKRTAPERAPAQKARSFVRNLWLRPPVFVSTVRNTHIFNIFLPQFHYSLNFDIPFLLNWIQAEYIPHMRHCQSAAPALPRDGAYPYSTGTSSIRFSGV